MAVRDYVAAITSLLPRGRAWRRNSDSTIGAIIQAIADEAQRVDDRAANLMREIRPSLTTELIPEWEADLGLPGDCAPAPTSDGNRRAAILAKYILVGRQDEAYLHEIAAAFNLEISVTNEYPFEMGINGMGDPVGGSEWRHVFTITISAPQDDPDTAAFRCTIDQLKPAHTVALYDYTGAWPTDELISTGTIYTGGTVLEGETITVTD